ncbi:MAG TPA: vitamin K epoxide reductase family protein [Candidatus Angelobacter sp.]|nr:vitamin K epoxide reductase family protein [Candidatus Angelobacter sp.]
MRWTIILLALAGTIAGSLALREHYRTDASPCSINEKWDCGLVNKSPFAVIGGIFDLLTNKDSMQPSSPQRMQWLRDIPVADVGIAGYLLLGVLAFIKRWRLLAAMAVPAMLFSLYLAHVEKDVLGVWCIYCVISLGIISMITLLSVITLVMDLKKDQQSFIESKA